MATQRDDDHNGYRQLLGDAVRRRREKIELTQPQLAKRLGRNRLYVGRLERNDGGVRLTLDTIEEIADALEMPTTELLRPFLERDARRNGFVITGVPVTDPKLHQRRRLVNRLTTAAYRLSLTDLRSLAHQAEAMAEQRSDASR